jgi:hypothetical protein
MLKELEKVQIKLPRVPTNENKDHDNPSMNFDDEFLENLEILKDSDPNALYDVLCLSIFLVWKEKKNRPTNILQFIRGAWIYYWNFAKIKAARTS